MELAIKVMRESVFEPREDGKANPLVGAVLVKPDGAVETACRGELRYGDHAEYTLLERKNRSEKLDGSTLYATLEPCAPGARCHPKLSCAERIVLARIKKVWVGIEDPDPTVDRKGIKYLQENEIKVGMFDRDLQEVIREANEEFIEQALERKEEEEKKEPVILSEYEAGLANTQLGDFSEDALERFGEKLKIDDTIGSPGFNKYLLDLGLIAQNNGDYIPTGFGIILLGKNPRLKMQQVGLKGTIEYKNGTEDVEDFDGPQIFVPEQAMEWLRNKLPNPIDRSGAERQEINKVFYELVREGVVNALVHRDYNIEGAKCQLIATPDKVTIKSPGRPVDPITIEQMRNFDAPMLSRNPVLHYVFNKLGLAEERGLGLKSLKTKAQEKGLPLPRYLFNDPYLDLEIFANTEALPDSVSSEVIDRLNEDEKAAWQYITTRETTSSAELMERTGYDQRKVQRILRKLVDLDLIQRIGSGPATRYKVKQ